MILPDKTAIYSNKSHKQSNINILEITMLSAWRGKILKNMIKNYSELAIRRYKRILYNTVQAKEFIMQQQEFTICCSVLNKMISIWMPASYSAV